MATTLLRALICHFLSFLAISLIASISGLAKPTRSLPFVSYFPVRSTITSSSAALPSR